MKFTLCNHEVQIDRADFETFLSHVWNIHKKENTTYLRTKIEGKYVKLHRLLLGVTDTAIKVDHRDRNGLNNQRSNLRIATNAQNSRNRSRVGGTSRFKGVFWDTSTQSWRAECCAAGKKKSLGRYTDEIAAALAYDLAALKLHADFANPNFSISEAALVHPKSLKTAIERCQRIGILEPTSEVEAFILANSTVQEAA